MTQSPTKSLLYEYRITSKEMRSLDQNIRRIYLGVNEDGLTVVWGEVPGCGEECNTNLSELILEFIMSCEGCKDPDVLDQYQEIFCSKISNALSDQLQTVDAENQLRSLFEILFASMEGEYAIPEDMRTSPLGFERCPICVASTRMGMQRGLDQAHGTYFKLIQQLVQKASHKYSFTPLDDGDSPGHALKLFLKLDSP